MCELITLCDCTYLDEASCVCKSAVNFPILVVRAELPRSAKK